MAAVWVARTRRTLGSLRKELPDALAAPGSHDDAEVAAMLRELGIALVEVDNRPNWWLRG